MKDTTIQCQYIFFFPQKDFTFSTGYRRSCVVKQSWVLRKKRKGSFIERRAAMYIGRILCEALTPSRGLLIGKRRPF